MSQDEWICLLSFKKSPREKDSSSEHKTSRGGCWPWKDGAILGRLKPQHIEQNRTNDIVHQWVLRWDTNQWLSLIWDKTDILSHQTERRLTRQGTMNEIVHYWALRQFTKRENTQWQRLSSRDKTSENAHQPERNEAVPRHGVSNKQVDAKTLTQGLNGLKNNGGHHLPGKKVNKQWTAYTTPSQIWRGYISVSKQQMHSKMHNKTFYGPQMVLSIQCSLSDSWCSQCCGRLEQHVGGIVDKWDSNSNIVAKTKLMISSVIVLANDGA